MKNLQFTQVRNLYWLAFLGVFIIRVISRTYPDLVVSVDAVSVSYTQLLFSFSALLSIVFCVWATYRIFREKGVGKALSIINGVLSIYMWAIIMIIQMIYILGIRKMPKGEVASENESEDS